MLKRSDVTICVPSSRRPKHALRVARTLIPGAQVFVADSEADEYLRVGFTRDELRTHPNLVGLARIRNWIVQACKTPVCIQIDDDFTHIMAMPGRKIRFIKNPAQIAEVIYSTSQLATDFGSRLFCWGSHAWPLYYKDHDPFGFKGPVSRALGTIGKEAKWDERLVASVDTDATMQELLDKRVVLTDQRFYFYCGQIGGNPGGLQALRTTDRLNLDQQLMRQKWGDFIQIDKKSKKGLSSNRITVARRQSWAGKLEEDE